jgi:hypothetical protein
MSINVNKFMVFYLGMENANSVRQLPLKILGISLIVFLLGAILLFIGFFLSLNSISWPLGWVLGSLIGSINYGFIIFQANRLTLAAKYKMRAGASPLYMVSRLGLFALGLLASVYIKLDGVELFNIFTIFLAYLVISGIIFLTGANFRIIKRSS